MLLEPFIIIPLSIIIIIVIIVIFFIKKRRNSNSDTKLEIDNKPDRDLIIKRANKKLAINPKDQQALTILADLYFEEKLFSKSFKFYSILSELSVLDSSIDQNDITIKYAISALNIKEYKIAYNNFLLVKNYFPDDFQINYCLGYLEYLRKRYERSVTYLVKAKKINPNDSQAYTYLGLSLQKLNKYGIALNMLQRAVELEPKNKTALFAIGECNYNLGKNEIALTAFTSLKDDPEFSANACTYAGIITMRYKKYEQAIKFFEKGLNNPDLKETLIIELKYYLANCYLKNNEISKAISNLEEIVKNNPNYKDADILLKKYGELERNFNLKVFLIGERRNFLSLCESLIDAQYPKATINTKDVSYRQNEYADIITAINSGKGEELFLFRFMRTSGQVGELLLRDLSSKIKEIKIEKGVCISAGSFSNEAKKFVEARPIDIVGKSDLLKLLKKI